MALDTYTNLQLAVASWMHRNNLTGSIPDFIMLAEARIKALLEMRLQSLADTVTTAIGDAFATAPTSLIRIRSMSIPNVRPTISYVTPDQYSSMYSDGRSGQPVNYTIIGDQIFFGPAPDAVYIANIVYEASIMPLSSTNQTNVILAKWPNVYLWGALKEAAKFSRDKQFEQECDNDFLAAINDANKLEWHSGGPMRMRVDTTTP